MPQVCATYFSYPYVKTAQVHFLAMYILFISATYSCFICFYWLIICYLFVDTEYGDFAVSDHDHCTDLNEEDDEGNFLMKYGVLMISLLSMVNFLRKLSLVFSLFLLTLIVEFQYHCVSKGLRQIFHKIHSQFRRYDCEGGIVCIFTICIS